MVASEFAFCVQSAMLGAVVLDRAGKVPVLFV
jgi:hypothetical protein